MGTCRTHNASDGHTSDLLLLHSSARVIASCGRFVQSGLCFVWVALQSTRSTTCAAPRDVLVRILLLLLQYELTFDVMPNYEYNTTTRLHRSRSHAAWTCCQSVRIAISSLVSRCETIFSVEAFLCSVCMFYATIFIYSWKMQSGSTFSLNNQYIFRPI